MSIAIKAVAADPAPALRQRMGIMPQRLRRGNWIDPGLCPPRGFMTAAVDFAMMPAAQRNRDRRVLGNTGPTIPIVQFEPLRVCPGPVRLNYAANVSRSWLA